MAHPDFRVGGRIFATLGYPDEGWAMVSLTPEQQEELVRTEPAVFVPVKGGWGRKGATNVRLKKARKGIVQQALAAARENRVSRPKSARRLRSRLGTEPIILKAEARDK